MEILSKFIVNPRIDKPWGNTLREKLPRSVRLRYVNWRSKERQQEVSEGNKDDEDDDTSNAAASQDEPCTIPYCNCTCHKKKGPAPPAPPPAPPAMGGYCG